MPVKSLYTKKLGRIVAETAQPNRAGKYHVISGVTENWTVVPDGSVHAVKAFLTQKEAVVYAKQTASRKAGEVIVHGKSGQMEDRISFAKK